MRSRFLPALLLSVAGVGWLSAQEQAQPLPVRGRVVQIQAAQPAAKAAQEDAEPEEKVADKKADKEEIKNPAAKPGQGEEAKKEGAGKTPAKTEPELPPIDRKPILPADPRMIWLHLMDGAVISGRLSIDEIDVETAFGSLKVPVGSIRSFTPGMASHPELLSQIERLIENLGSSDFGEREQAQKQILKIGLPAREALRGRADDRDTERRTRIKTILIELEESQSTDDDSEEELPLSQELLAQRDTIETTEFTIVGKIVPKSFSLASPYGPLTVKLSDIRRGRRETNVRPDVKRTLAVEGSHIVHRGTMNTKLRLERGDKVIIEATGQITMTPWGHQAMSTPDGAPNFGWYVPNTIPSGALIGRIGDKGEYFKIGSRQTFTADRAGTLELAVAMQGDYAQNNFPGRYNIKVTVKPK